MFYIIERKTTAKQVLCEIFNFSLTIRSVAIQSMWNLLHEATVHINLVLYNWMHELIQVWDHWRSTRRQCTTDDVDPNSDE